MNLETVRLSFHEAPLDSKVIILQKLFSRMGFGDVEIMDRFTSKQKSRYGGYELYCRFHAGMAPFTAVVKVVKDSIHLRMLCELAGTVLLRKASFGVLVASKKGSDKMLTYSSLFSAVRINIIDGDELAELLNRYKIAVRSNGEPDYAYFGYLEENSKQILAAMNRLPR